MDKKEMIQESVLDYILERNLFKTERDIDEKIKITKAVFKAIWLEDYSEFEALGYAEHLEDLIDDQNDYIKSLKGYTDMLKKNYDSLYDITNKSNRIISACLIINMICWILNIVNYLM